MNYIIYLYGTLLRTQGCLTGKKQIIKHNYENKTVGKVIQLFLKTQ